MRRTSQDLYDGIGTWKRRPIRAGKKTYMPSHKRWGKITVTKMTPVPEGTITTTETWQEVLLVNADLISDVSKLIMGGGDSFEVATDIIKLVTKFNNKEKE